MKHLNKNEDSTPAGPRLIPVRFEFADAVATRVHIAGTFNGWKPAGKAMEHLGNGHWYTETVLPPGSYEYCLVVDGRWIHDPLAEDYVPNTFGGINSVVNVASHLKHPASDSQQLFLENTAKQKNRNI